MSGTTAIPEHRSVPSILDPTFRSYTSDQAALYAASRLSYPRSLYDHILNYHTSTGGSRELLLDVGCGTGNATKDIALFFENAIGVDPGAEMVNQARARAGSTGHGKPVLFHIAGAEDLAAVDGVKDGSVDLVTAAMSAHWFSMLDFWTAAARVLKPGGTAALWTRASLYCHPATPNAPAIQNILNHLEQDILGPHELQPNRISRTLYKDLALPWTIEPRNPNFSEAAYERNLWDVDGVLSDGRDFFGGGEELTLGELEQGLSTASMVTRWRESHPELAGGDDDCVFKTIRAVQEAMGKGEEDKNNVKIKTGAATVLLLFKRL